MNKKAKWIDNNPLTTESESRQSLESYSKSAKLLVKMVGSKYR